MTKNTKNSNVEKIESVGEAVSKTELFFKQNGKLLAYIGGGLVIVAAIVILAIQFYIKPLKEEAIAQTFVAEQAFRNGEFEKALKGDGNALGFEQIIDEYGAKGGKSVYLYAGICQLQLGNAAEAIAYLESYTSDDPILSARAYACIGDAYSMQENFAKALDFYLKAAGHADNIFAAGYLLKAGIICEEMGNSDEALAHYRTIKEKYPQSFEGYEVDKYISRIEIRK